MQEEITYQCDKCGKWTNYEGSPVDDKYLCDECYIDHLLRSIL